jgi:hypothetical protein
MLLPAGTLLVMLATVLVAFDRSGGGRRRNLAARALHLSGTARKRPSKSMEPSWEMSLPFSYGS